MTMKLPDEKMLTYYSTRDNMRTPYTHLPAHAVYYNCYAPMSPSRQRRVLLPS